MPPRLRIGIVGLGSRGLSVLERVTHLAGGRPDLPIEVLVFEPAEPGVGVHGTDLPDYLVLNTIAEQLTIFPGRESIEGALPDDLRTKDARTFLSWCGMNGLSVRPDGSVGVGHGRPVEGTDFLPRRVLGQYLAWAFARIAGACPGHVRVVVHREQVAAVVPAADQGGFAIRTLAGRSRTVDRLALTLGHGTWFDAGPPSAHRRCLPAYPPDVSRIGPGDVVGIEGLGLAAQDALAAMTVGRGGRFDGRASGSRVYRPSGSEPRVVMFSDSGLPFRVRPDTWVGREKHRPVAFTRAAVRALVDGLPKGAADFETHFLPLILLEMRVAHRLARAGMEGTDGVRRRMEAAAAEGALEKALDDLDRGEASFDPLDHLHFRVPAEAEAPAWAEAFIREDLRQGRLGLRCSPLKNAIEVWRDLRDEIRLAVDHGTLSCPSRTRFYAVWAPAINRMVAGPQKERHEELLALMDSGLVEIAARPARSQASPSGRLTVAFANARAVDFDWLVKAHLPRFAPDRPGSLVHSLLARGFLTKSRCRPPDSIALDGSCAPLGKEGNGIDTVAVLGPMAEGETYYNHYVPSPSGPSRAFTDAHRVAKRLMRAGDGQSPPVTTSAS